MLLENTLEILVLAVAIINKLIDRSRRCGAENNHCLFTTSPIGRNLKIYRLCELPSTNHLAVQIAVLDDVLDERGEFVGRSKATRVLHKLGEDFQILKI